MASDTHVKEVGLEQVLAEGAGAFMLFYERVIPYSSHQHHHHPQSQEGSYGKSSMRSTSASTIPTTATTTMATVMEMERHQSSGVYSSTSPKSSEETLRPGMDALNSSRSNASTAVNGEDENTKNPPSVDSGIELTNLAQKAEAVAPDESNDEDDEEQAHRRRPVPRILLNVSTKKRARSISVLAMERVPSSSTADDEDHQNKDRPQTPNGDTSHAPTSSQPQKSSPPNPASPKKTKLKKPPPAPLEDHSIEHRTSSSPRPPSPSTPTTPTAPAISPSSSPQKKRHRSKQQHMQQDNTKSPPRPLQPTVGLRA